MELQKIPEDAELIIFDFYNALVVSPDSVLRFRNNVDKVIFRLKLQSRKMAISSSSPIEEIENFPGFATVGVFMNGVYGKEHVVNEGNGKYKDLGKICQEQGVKPEKAVFIADDYNGIDRRSADRFGIPFIHVTREDTDLSYLLN